MAVQFASGVVIGADSRTTTGSYIANRVTDKLTPIHDRIYCCRSGSAADTQAVADIVAYHTQLYATQHAAQPKVRTVAKLFSELCYANKDRLQAGIIVAGWDAKEGGKVFSVPLGGSCHQQPFAIGGSGSTYIYGWCDANYKAGMSEKECLEFVSRALSHAMSRDGSSGGVVRMAVITEQGIQRHFIPGDKLPQHAFEL